MTGRSVYSVLNRNRNMDSNRVWPDQLEATANHSWEVKQATFL